MCKGPLTHSLHCSEFVELTLFTYFFKHFYAGGGLGEDGYRYKKVFFEKLPIPKMIGTPNQQVIERANENINIEKNCLLLFNFNEDEIKEIERD